MSCQGGPVSAAPYAGTCGVPEGVAADGGGVPQDWLRDGDACDVGVEGGGGLVSCWPQAGRSPHIGWSFTKTGKEMSQAPFMTHPTSPE